MIHSCCRIVVVVVVVVDARQPESKMPRFASLGVDEKRVLTGSGSDPARPTTVDGSEIWLTTWDVYNPVK